MDGTIGYRIIATMRALTRHGALALVIGLTGCASNSGRIIESPQSVEQQQQSILQIVPIGTPRAEVEKRLHEAGISLSPGASDTIAYCALWNRDDGERWEMNVALLFDRTGRLYRVRSASATPDWNSAGVEAEPAPRTNSPARNTAPTTSGWQPAGTSAQGARFDREASERPREAFPGAKPASASSR